ncbi:uncharacterized protein C22orf15 [Aplochiton taeniatus]
MFITVLFGDSQIELFNLSCRVTNFIHSLKERCDLDMKDCVDLMDKSGELMNLSGKENSVEQASSLLTERQSYVLLRVCRGDGTEGNKYVPQLKDIDKSHPELSEVLRQISNPNKERDRKGSSQRKGCSQRDISVSQVRSKITAGNKKNHPVKQ